MIELQLGLIADSAQIDSGGKLFILGEFRYIFASHVPATHQSMALIMRLVAPSVEVQGKKSSLRLQFVDEDGHDLFPKNPPELPLQFGPVGPAERGLWHAQVILNLGLLPLPKYGRYVIHVWVNDHRAGEMNFFVTKPPAEQPGQPG